MKSYVNWFITVVFDSFFVTFLYIPPANNGVNLQTTERKQIAQYIAGKLVLH